MQSSNKNTFKSILLKKQNIDYFNLKIFFLFLSAIVIYPLLTTTTDLWDGSIVDYAAKTGNLAIFDTWFYESGWPLVAELYKLLHLFSAHIGVDYKTAANFAISACFLLSALEVYLISYRSLHLSKFPSLLGGGLVLVMPSLALYLSSIFLMHAVFIYFCLIGSRFYLEDMRLKKALGIILVLVSFQHNSNPLMFFTILGGAYLFAGRREFFIDASVLLMCAVVLFLFKNCFPAHGLYVGYNSISLSHLVDLGLWKHYLIYISFFYSPLLIFLAAAIYSNPKHFSPVVIFIILILINCFPYMIVGKYPILEEMGSPDGWSHRFVINLYVMSCLFFAAFLDANLKFGSKSTAVSSLFIYCLFFCFSAGVLFYSYSAKSKSLLYQELFIDQLKRQKPPMPGFVFVENTTTSPTSYEMNYYFYKAYGKAAWASSSTLGSKDLYGMDKMPKYMDKYIFPDYQDICDYTYKVTDNLNSLRIMDYLTYLYFGLHGGLEKRVTYTLTRKQISCTG